MKTWNTVCKILNYAGAMVFAALVIICLGYGVTDVAANISRVDEPFGLRFLVPLSGLWLFVQAAKWLLWLERKLRDRLNRDKVSKHALN